MQSLEVVMWDYALRPSKTGWLTSSLDSSAVLTEKHGHVASRGDAVSTGQL